MWASPPVEFQSLDLIQLLDWTASFVSCKGVMIIYIYIYIFSSLSPSWRVLLTTLLVCFFPGGPKSGQCNCIHMQFFEKNNNLCNLFSRTAVRCGEKTYFQPLLANRPHGSVQLNYWPGSFSNCGSTSIMVLQYGYKTLIEIRRVL